ncbi:hypothetical protein [Myxococcus stipitatus]
MNLGGRYVLGATCEANQVNPKMSLADVLLSASITPTRASLLLPHE